MRVLLINHFPLKGSGSGVYTANIANSLMNLGHEVSCVFPSNELVSDTYRFRIHPVYFANAEGNAPTPDALPFNFPCFTTHPKSVNTFETLTDEELSQYNEAFRAAIEQEVREFQPDIIHAGHIWLLAEIASTFDIPLVITAHGTDLIGFRKSDRFRESARTAASRASSIVSISQRNLTEVIDAFPFAEEKTHLVSNGYDANVFYPVDVPREQVFARYGITKPYKKLVSFAGKFAHFKGIDILLHAAAQYEDGNTATLLAGEGELFDEMNELAAELGLHDVYFLHNQTHDCLRELYSAADVSLVPSRREPFGLVAIEAGACGAPVIGTNGGGIADILVPETGVLIPEEDADALAAAVKGILSGERIFNRQTVASYTLEHFAQDQYTAQMVNALYLPACE